MAEIYHQNITPSLYNSILKQWGISKEIVDRLKIGYATAGKDIQKSGSGNAPKSGLVYASYGKRI